MIQSCWSQSPGWGDILKANLTNIFALQNILFGSDKATMIESLWLNPYFVGIWLGDGRPGNTRVTNVDVEIIDFLEEYAKSLGLCYTRENSDPLNNGYIHWRINRKLSGNYHPFRTPEEFERRKQFLSIYLSREPIPSIEWPQKKAWIEEIEQKGEEAFLKHNAILLGLKRHNLLNNKHIPEVYMCSDRKSRLQVLAGLIDSDGYRRIYTYVIAQKNFRLADDRDHINQISRIPCRSEGNIGFLHQYS